MELFLFQFFRRLFSKNRREQIIFEEKFGTSKGSNKTKNLELVKNVVIHRKGSVRDEFSKKVVEKSKGSIVSKIGFKGTAKIYFKLVRSRTGKSTKFSIFRRFFLQQQ
jgi:hypothetical protein